MIKTCIGMDPSKVPWKISIETQAVCTLLYRKALKPGKIISLSSVCLHDGYGVDVVQPCWYSEEQDHGMCGNSGVSMQQYRSKINIKNWGKKNLLNISWY